MLINKYDPFNPIEEFTNKDHEYFARILMNSNKEILDSQRKSIYILRKAIENIEKSPDPQTLIEIYQTVFFEEEANSQKKL